MAGNDLFAVRFALGKGKNLGKAQNITEGWLKFTNRFKVPRSTGESRAQFDKLSKEEQDDLKALGGWFIGTQVEEGKRTRRTLRSRNLLTLDYDYATPEFIVLLQQGLTWLDGYEFMYHSSRRHTPNKPRIRVIIPLKRPVDPDEYIALSRWVAFKIEGSDPMPMVDMVSFRVAQMMFMPSISKDNEYLFERSAGKLLDPDVLLADFDAERGDWKAYGNLPRSDKEGTLRKSADKAERPREKAGIVGDWCRAYNVAEAIEEFLSDCYAPADDYSEKPRYTYLKGTSTSGAVLEDDGDFLYSHHGSDPTADRLVNSFDLVRIHLFGELDEDSPENTKPNNLPSWKAMTDFAKKQPKFQTSRAESKHDFSAMFTDDDVDPESGEDQEPNPDEEDAELLEQEQRLRDFFLDEGEVDLAAGAPPPKGKTRELPPIKEGWELTLDRDQNGDLMNTVTNVATIIQNDPRIRASVEYNAFRDQKVVRKRIKAKGLKVVPAVAVADPTNGDPWHDIHSTCIRLILEAGNGPGKVGWGIKVSDRDLEGAINAWAHQRSFHPVQERLDSLSWDGQSRAESLFIDYLGCPDTPYFRETARKFLIAAVARAYEPGHKFDFVPILEGKQGLRKSTFIRVLAMNWFGELKGDFSKEKELVEQMKGCWIMEQPELSAATRSIIEEIKAFTSATQSVIRESYAHHSKVFKRQCVFMGSTNESEYLIDATGNRRWWPIRVLVDEIDTSKLAREVSQIWAEAVVMFRAMRAEQPEGDLPLYLTERDAQAEAILLQEGARSSNEMDYYEGALRGYLDKPLHSADFDPREQVVTACVCLQEIWTKALGETAVMTQSNSRMLSKLLAKIGWIKGTQPIRLGEYGKPRVWYRPGHIGSRRVPWEGEEEKDLV